MRVFRDSAAVFFLFFLAGCAASAPRIDNSAQANAVSERGLDRFEAGDYGNALADLNAVIAHGSPTENDYSRRAAIYAALKEYDKAVVDLDHVVQIAPHQWEAYVERAGFHQRLGQYDRAIGDLDAAMADSPQQPELLRRRAYLKIIAGNFDGAVSDYDALAQIAENPLAGLLGRGVVLYLQGQWRDATAIFEHILEQDPNDGLTALWLAKASLRSGLPVDWQELMPLRASDPNWTMAEALLSVDRADELSAEITHLDAHKITECERSLFLGTWRVIHDHGDGALAAFQKAREQCPRDSVEGSEAKIELLRLDKTE